MLHSRVKVISGMHDVNNVQYTMVETQTLFIDTKDKAIAPLETVIKVTQFSIQNYNNHINTCQVQNRNIHRALGRNLDEMYRKILAIDLTRWMPG